MSRPLLGPGAIARHDPRESQRKGRLSQGVGGLGIVGCGLDEACFLLLSTQGRATQRSRSKSKSSYPPTSQTACPCHLLYLMLQHAARRTSRPGPAYTLSAPPMHLEGGRTSGSHALHQVACRGWLLLASWTTINTQQER